MPIESAGTAPLHDLLGRWVPSASSDPTLDSRQLDLFGAQQTPTSPPQGGLSVQPPTASAGPHQSYAMPAPPVPLIGLYGRADAHWLSVYIDQEVQTARVGADEFPLTPVLLERLTNIILDAYAVWQAEQRVNVRNALLSVQQAVAVQADSSTR